MMVRFGVVYGYDDAAHGGQDWTSETGKSVGWLRLYERAEGDWSCAAGLGDGNKVNGEVRCEQPCAVTGDSVCWAVLNNPAACEWVHQIDGSIHGLGLFLSTLMLAESGCLNGIQVRLC